MRQWADQGVAEGAVGLLLLQLPKSCASFSHLGVMQDDEPEYGKRPRCWNYY